MKKVPQIRFIVLHCFHISPMRMVSKAFLPFKGSAIVSIVAPRDGGSVGAYNGQWKVLVRLAFEPLLRG